MGQVRAVALIAATAWVVLLGEAFAGGGSAGGASVVLGHLCGVKGAPLAGLAECLLRWPVMVAAMMLPGVAIDMRRTRSASNPAVLLLFLAGFFVVWEIFGFVIFVAGGIAQSALDAAGVRPDIGDVSGAALLGLAAVALFSSAPFMSRRSASPPDPAPLGAIGLRTGLEGGIESVRSCWSIMVLMMAAKLHDPVSVAALTLFAAYVRRGRFGIPLARLAGAAAPADAVAALAMRTPLL
jgi:predicted metal-binding membrane protein